MGQCRTGRVMKCSIFFLVLASATAAPQFEGLKDIFSALSGDDEAGEVNGDYEQVPYTTLKQFDGYEMRQYPSVKWACTEATYKMEKEDSESRDSNEFNLTKMVQEMMSGKGWKSRPSSKMFMKLFRYISGVNEEQEEIEMTVPVLTRMTILEDKKINKQMCFYLNKAHQENPPTPTEEGVVIEENQEFTVFVHTFGGYAMRDRVWIEEAQKFADKLSSKADSIDFSKFYTAGYDSPMKFWNRRNEVMFIV